MKLLRNIRYVVRSFGTLYAINSKDLKKAQEHLEKLQMSGDDELGMYFRNQIGNLSFHKQEYAVAAESYEQVITYLATHRADEDSEKKKEKGFDDIERMRWWHGRALVNARSLEDCMLVCERLRDTDLAAVIAILDCAVEKWAKQDWDKGVAWAEQLGGFVGDGVANGTLAVYAAKYGREAECQQRIDAALENMPTSAVALARLADAALRVKRNFDARTFAEAGLEIDSSDELATIALAASLGRLGEVERALEALEGHPVQGRHQNYALYCRGRCYVELGDLEKARRVVEDLQEQDSEYAAQLLALIDGAAPAS